MKKSILLACIAGVVMSSQAATVTVNLNTIPPENKVYVEEYAGGTHSAASVGMEIWNGGGTDLSAEVLGSTTMLNHQWVARSGVSKPSVLIHNNGTITRGANELAFSGYASNSKAHSFMAQVGTTWYITDVTGTENALGSSDDILAGFTISDAVWHIFHEGAFDAAGFVNQVPSGGGSALPAGDIVNTGVLGNGDADAYFKTFAVTVYEAPTTVATPTGVAAEAGDSLVTLNWNDDSSGFLDFYNVYRSLETGAEYEVIASNLTASAQIDSNLVNGTTYYYVVTAVDGNGTESSYSAEVSATPFAPIPQAPFVPHSFPGTIQFEDFDIGSPEVAYHDSSLGNNGNSLYRDGEDVDLGVDGDLINIGWTTPGEWLEYTIANIPSGMNTVNIRYAVFGTDAKSIQFFANDVSIGNATLPATGGWTTYTNVVIQGINFPEGSDVVVQVKLSTGGYNLDWFEIYGVYDNPYYGWADQYGGTNLLGSDTDDYDEDGVANLAEYALNGNPTNGFDDTEIELISDGGLYYVHAVASDDIALTYTVETKDQLPHGSWANLGYTAAIGTNVTGGAYDYVTNGVPTTDSVKFIHVSIEKNNPE